MEYPIHRFRGVADLTDREVEILRTLGDRPVNRAKGEPIHREGQAVEGFHLHLAGWISSSIVLASGKRLIQKVHLPGAMLGTPSMVLSFAADNLVPLTPAVTAFVPFKRFGRLFVEAPRLAALLTIATQLERLALMDALAVTGQASAREQFARMLIDFHTRLTPIGAVVDNSFELPLTQEVMGDLLGLTSVHVNRTVKALERDGLIARRGQRFTLADMPGLRALCPLPPRRPRFNLEWLPPPG